MEIDSMTMRWRRMQHWRRAATPSAIVQSLHELAIDYDHTDISIVTKSLISRLRMILMPLSQLATFDLSTWDEQFTFLLINCYFPIKPSLQTLKRFLYYVIQTDFAMEDVQIESMQYLMLSQSRVVADSFALYYDAIDCFASLHSTGETVDSYMKMLREDLILTHLFEGHHNPHIIREVLISSRQIQPSVLTSFIKRGLNISHIPENAESLLHTAARCFHHNLIAIIVGESFVLATNRDPVHGLTPIQMLCRTISVCKWESYLSPIVLGQMIADLLGNHLHLMWDTKFQYQGMVLSAFDVSPLYRLVSTNNAVIINTTIKLAAAVSKDFWDQDVLKHCVRRVIASNDVKTFVFMVESFSLQKNYQEYLAHAIWLRSSACFRHMIEESVKHSSLMLNHPSYEYPLLHLAIWSDVKANGNSSDKFKSSQQIKDGRNMMHYSEELLLSYETNDAIALLRSVHQPSSSSSSLRKSFSHLSRLSSTMSAVSFAAYLNYSCFLIFIKDYCHKYGLSSKILVHGIDGINPLSSSLLGNSQDSLSFYSDSFLLDDVSSIVISRGL